jgi:replicative DNA helicase
MSIDKKILETFSNPVVWCESYLRDPNDREKPLLLRSYQKEVLTASRIYDNIILQWGRRMGKSVSMCADCLWWTSMYPLIRMIENKEKKQKPYKVVIFTPYESQIKELWNTFAQLIGDSPLLMDQIEKIRSSDIHEIKFKNGSIIQGYTVGISSSNQGTSLRGISADTIFIDEMDFIPSEIVEQVIIPITTTHKHCKLRVCSTPSGARDLYFKWCTQSKELGWFHTHYPSWHPDNDNWLSIEKAKELNIPITKSSEFQVKSVTSSDSYVREYGAEFGEEFGGVYKHHLINKNLFKYGRNIDVSDPDVFDPCFAQNPEHKYIIGVDWNSYINGGQIVLLEFCTTPTFVTYFDDDKNQEILLDFTGRYRLFYRKSIKTKDSTQRMTRQEIIRLLTHYKVDYIYVDYGAGDTNIEELSLYGKQHPELNLSQKLRVIDAGAVVEHYDHILQKHVKKRNKSLMVNFSVLSLEEGLFVLPKEEDADTRLVGQMRNYMVKHVTSRGEYAYEGADHILDAFNLAVYGFQQNFGQLLVSRAQYSVFRLADPRMSLYPQRASVVSGPIQLTKFKSNGTYNMPLRDPERPVGYQKPQRGFLPGFGSRQSIGITGNGRRGF